MHEFSIVESLISIAINTCRNEGFSKIEKVRIVVGKATGVMPAALFFAFDALKKDPIIRDATLFIEETLLTGYCNDCNYTFTTDEGFIFVCPKCESSSFKIISGMELNIAEIEVL